LSPRARRRGARGESVGLERRGGEERVERLRLEGSVAPNEIRLEPSRFVWQGQEIRLSGRLTQPAANSAVHATLQGEVPLATVSRRVGFTGALSGLATVDAAIDGLWSAPRVAGRVPRPDLAAGPVRARHVRVEGTFVDGSLRVPDLQADLPGGAVNGALTVSPEPSGGARSVELTLDGLHLPQALAALGPGSLRMR